MVTAHTLLHLLLQRGQNQIFKPRCELCSLRLLETPAASRPKAEIPAGTGGYFGVTGEVCARLQPGKAERAWTPDKFKKDQINGALPAAVSDRLGAIGQQHDTVTATINNRMWVTAALQGCCCGCGDRCAPAFEGRGGRRHRQTGSSESTSNTTALLKQLFRSQRAGGDPRSAPRSRGSRRGRVPAMARGVGAVEGALAHQQRRCSHRSWAP